MLGFVSPLLRRRGGVMSALHDTIVAFALMKFWRGPLSIVAMTPCAFRFFFLLGLGL